MEVHNRQLDSRMKKYWFHETGPFSSALVIESFTLSYKRSQCLSRLCPLIIRCMLVLHRKVICVVLSEPLRPHCKLQPHRRRRRRPTKRQDSVLVVILSEIIQIDDSL